jgi:hypothetical protein
MSDTQEREVTLFGCSYLDDSDWKAEGSKVAWPSAIHDYGIDHVHNYARCGSSVYYSYTQFQTWISKVINTANISSAKDPSYLFKDKLVIFGWTAYSRMPVLPANKTGSAWMYDPQPNETPEFNKAVELWQKYFFDEDYMMYVANHIWRDVQDTCERLGIYLINVDCFPDDIMFGNKYPTKFPVITGLDEISARESGYEPEDYGEGDPIQWKETVINNGPGFNPLLDTRPCHLTIQNNAVMAELIGQLVTVQPFDEHIHLPALDLWHYSEATWATWSSDPFGGWSDAVK